MGVVNASFHGSYVLRLGRVPMRAMSRVILELHQAGEGELARELTKVRDRWARAIGKRASSFAPARPPARATEHSAGPAGNGPSDAAKAAHAAVERLRCKTLVRGMREGVMGIDPGGEVHG